MTQPATQGKRTRVRPRLRLTLTPEAVLWDITRLQEQGGFTPLFLDQYVHTTICKAVVVAERTRIRWWKPNTWWTSDFHLLRTYREHAKTVRHAMAYGMGERRLFRRIKQSNV